MKPSAESGIAFATVKINNKVPTGHGPCSQTGVFNMTNQLVTDFEETLRSAEPNLRSLTETEAGSKAHPDTWSAKQILGHLIDSACNNHHRFVTAQIKPDLVFSGYDQDAWVLAQRYQEADWSELVRLFIAYNQHIARIVSAIPQDELHRQRTRHTLHQVAWRTVPESEPTTLDYFVRDYVAHMKHHLEQIFELKQTSDSQQESER